MKAKDITGLENAALQLLISFLTVTVFVGFKQGFAINIPQSSILPIFILGLLNTGIGCYFYFSSIGNLPVQTVAVCGYLEPLSAVLFNETEINLLNDKINFIQANSDLNPIVSITYFVPDVRKDGGLYTTVISTVKKSTHMKNQLL